MRRGFHPRFIREDIEVEVREGSDRAEFVFGVGLEGVEVALVDGDHPRFHGVLRFRQRDVIVGEVDHLLHLIAPDEVIPGMRFQVEDGLIAVTEVAFREVVPHFPGDIAREAIEQ